MPSKLECMASRPRAPLDQIAPFESVLHAGEKWEGKRTILSFFTTKKIYTFCKEFGGENVMQVRVDEFGNAINL